MFRHCPSFLGCLDFLDVPGTKEGNGGKLGVEIVGVGNGAGFPSAIVAQNMERHLDSGFEIFAPTSTALSSSESENSSLHIVGRNLRLHHGKGIVKVRKDSLDLEEASSGLSKSAPNGGVLSQKGSRSSSHESCHDPNLLCRLVFNMKRDSICSTNHQRSIQEFELLQVIGKGAWGKVVLGSLKSEVSSDSEQRKYAIKIMKKSEINRFGMMGKIVVERKVLTKIDHPFVVKLYCSFQDYSHLYLVMEYCSGGDLFFHMNRLQQLSESAAKFYFAELILALGHLHENTILYRDIKPENVALDGKGHLKLIDFGLAKFGILSPVRGASTLCGTMNYLAPEVIVEGDYGFCADWWAAGILLYEMVIGKTPWYDFIEDEKLLYEHILLAPLEIPYDTCSHSFEQILRDLLQKNPYHRLGKLTAKQVKRHAFFRGFDWDRLTDEQCVPPITPIACEDDITCNFQDDFTCLPVNSDVSIVEDEPFEIPFETEESHIPLRVPEYSFG